MSNKKKKKPAGSRMSPATKDKIKTCIGTIISNDACIKAAREYKGAMNILPITLGLVAVILAVLPTFITRMNVQGSAYLFSAPTTGYDQGLAEFVYALSYDEADNPRTLDLVIGQDGKCNWQTSSVNTLLDGKQWYTLQRSSTDSPVFEVFFNTDPDISDAKFFERIDTNLNPFTGANRDTSADPVKVFQASYMAFGRESLRCRKRTQAQTFTALYGQYDRVAGVNLRTLAPSEGKPSDAAYVASVRKNFTDFVNKTYETMKIQGTWQYTGIFAAVDLGLILLFGLVLFIMTRGKRNPLRVYTFWETQKMAYYGSFTPGLLAMALGFWLTNYAFVLFMFAYGMRMMWMSMRSMKPAA